MGGMLRKWEELPEFMRISEIRPYYDVLNQRRGQLFLKRVFDIVVALLLLIVLSLPILFIAVMIKLDSEGPIMFRQSRVTAYGKVFKIHKFRTMVNNADQMGTGVTVCDDSRITKIGQKLRNARLDELPQLLDVLSGDMSFVGTRPESVKYVKIYQKEYYATLLLPAGITSEASVRFKDEAALFQDAVNVEQIYIEKVLPEKMKYNLQSIYKFNCVGEIITMLKTIIFMFK